MVRCFLMSHLQVTTTKKMTDGKTPPNGVVWGTTTAGGSRLHVSHWKGLRLISTYVDGKKVCQVPSTALAAVADVCTLAIGIAKEYEAQRLALSELQLRSEEEIEKMAGGKAKDNECAGEPSRESIRKRPAAQSTLPPTSTESLHPIEKRVRLNGKKNKTAHDAENTEMPESVQPAVNENSDGVAKATDVADNTMKDANSRPYNNLDGWSSASDVPEDFSPVHVEFA